MGIPGRGQYVRKRHEGMEALRMMSVQLRSHTLQHHDKKPDCVALST